jgi:hypothetical protein
VAICGGLSPGVDTTLNNTYSIWVVLGFSFAEAQEAQNGVAQSRLCPMNMIRS